MKVIFVESKDTFQKSQLDKLIAKMHLSPADLIFLESQNDINSADKIFSSDEEKILGLAPEIVNWEFKNETIDKIKNLKGVCLATTSYNWVDGAYLKKKGIPLTNSPHYSTEAVAEHAIFLMLSIARKIPLIIDNKWELDYKEHIGFEVKGKTMGIIGLGSIGSRIAEIGAAIGMDVIYWSKNSKNKNYKYVELNDLFNLSDFIFPTYALNDETKQIINKHRINLMKPTASLVNVVSIDIYDYKYLFKKIESNELYGLGADDKKHKRLKNLNILVSPDMAWYTKESLERNINIWIESILSVYTENLINVVN